MWHAGAVRFHPLMRTTEQCLVEAAPDTVRERMREIAVLRASVDAGDGGLGAEVTRLAGELAAQRRRNIMLEECLERAGVHLEDEGADAWADVLPAPTG